MTKMWKIESTMGKMLGISECDGMRVEVKYGGSGVPKELKILPEIHKVYLG